METRSYERNKCIASSNKCLPSNKEAIQFRSLTQAHRRVFGRGVFHPPFWAKRRADRRWRSFGWVGVVLKRTPNIEPAQEGDLETKFHFQPDKRGGL